MEEPHDEFPACVSVANEEEEQDLHHHHHDAKQVAAPRTRSKTAQDDDDDDGEDEADEASVAAEESKLHPPYSRTNKDEDEEEEEEQKPAAKDTSLDKELLTQPHEEQEEAAAEEESRLEKGHESNEEEEEDEEEKQAEPEPKKPPLTPTEQRRARIFNRTFGKEDKKRKLRAQLEMLSSPTASSPPRKATRRDETTQNSRAAELSNIVISPVRRAALAYERVPITPVQRGGKGDDQGSSSSSNSPYRRSSRMRVPPLAFWKNEKIVYGPNDDPDSGIVAKNMPVPKAIVRANDATTTTLVRSPPRKKAPTVSPSPAKKAAKARRASPKKKTTPPSPKPKVASKSAQPHRGIGRKLPFAQPRASMAAASVDNSEEEEEELLEESVYSSISPRRSKRKRCPPLAYWKNETMDKRQRQGTSSREAAVSATKKGKKSPAKALTLNKKKMSTPDTRRPLRAAKATSLPMQARNRPPPPRPLDLPEYAYVTGEAAALMNLDSQQVEEMKAVAYHDKVEYRPLPRMREQGIKPGDASQAFGFQPTPGSPLSGYLAGHLILPRRGTKEEEPVGSCTHIFTVVSGQPGALEVAYAAEGEDFDAATAIRFLLGSPGDLFRIPAGNRYRIQNHSPTTPCCLTWTIIRPHARGT